MPKKEVNIGINFRHSAIGEMLWMLSIIKSISEHHNKKVIIFTRKETKAKVILENEDYIKEIIYLPFRKGIYQINEIMTQAKILRKRKINYFYILEEIVRPCLAAKIAGVKNIFSYGKKKQQKYLSQIKFLNQNIYNKHEYIRGVNFLKIMNIKHKNIKIKLSLNNKKLRKIKKKYSKYNKRIFLALQASEKFRTWPTEFFLKLINQLSYRYKNNIIFLLCNKSFNAELNKIKSKIIVNKNKILSLENHKFGIIKYFMKISDVYVGCDSGPSMLSDLLDTKTFVLYGATAPLPYKNNIYPIYSSKKKYLQKNLIVNKYQKNNSYMEDISSIKVFNKIKKFLD